MKMLSALHDAPDEPVCHTLICHIFSFRAEIGKKSQFRLGFVLVGWVTASFGFGLTQSETGLVLPVFLSGMHCIAIVVNSTVNGC